MGVGAEEEFIVGATFAGTNCTFQGTPDFSSDTPGPFCGNDCGYTPPPRNETDGAWVLVEPGECVADGACIVSHARFGSLSYGDYQACIFVANFTGILKVEAFAVQQDSDWLCVLDEDGKIEEKFSGLGTSPALPTGLVDRVVEVGTTFTWTTDVGVSRSGWKLCLEPLSS